MKKPISRKPSLGSKSLPSNTPAMEPTASSAAIGTGSATPSADPVKEMQGYARQILDLMRAGVKQDLRDLPTDGTDPLK